MYLAAVVFVLVAMPRYCYIFCYSVSRWHSWYSCYSLLLCSCAAYAATSATVAVPFANVCAYVATSATGAVPFANVCASVVFVTVSVVVDAACAHVATDAAAADGNDVGSFAVSDWAVVLPLLCCCLTWLSKAPYSLSVNALSGCHNNC
jgi:hypothetical protein